MRGLSSQAKAQICIGSIFVILLLKIMYGFTLPEYTLRNIAGTYVLLHLKSTYGIFSDEHALFYIGILCLLYIARICRAVHYKLCALLHPKHMRDLPSKKYVLVHIARISAVSRRMSMRGSAS